MGDSGLLLPCAALIAIWLGVAPRTRNGAMRWVIIFGLGSSIVLASKLAFLGWGIGSARLDFTGVSGHTMLATSIWPVAFWLRASRWGHAPRVAFAITGWMLAFLIGISRLVLEAHSISEVLAGYVMGGIVSVTFLAIQHNRPHPKLRWPWIAVSLVLPLVFVPIGAPAPTQDLIERIAVRVAHIERPFTRDDLHRR